MTDAVQASRRHAAWRGIHWPVIVAALLAGHVFIVSGALLLSSTLIPGASGKPIRFGDELRWDDLQALRSASKQVGWTLEIELGETQELNGNRSVSFLLRDAVGTPIRDASLRIALYHHAHPNTPIETTLPPDPLNVARTAVLDINRQGTWRVNAQATRGDVRFLVEDDFWVGKPKGAAR